MVRRPLHDPWEGTDGTRVRVLVECEPSTTSSLIATAIEERGYAVRVCDGPARDRGCVLLDQGACGLVDGADVIVNLLHPADPETRRVLGAVSQQRRPPAVVTGRGRLEPEHAAADDDCEIHRHRLTAVDDPVTAATLLAAIQTALEERNRPIPIWGDGFC